MINEDCNCDTPEIPQYAPTPPAQDDCGCDGAGRPAIYTPPDSGSGGKPVEVLAGDDIVVDDLSDVSTYRFRVHYSPYVGLAATMNGPVPYISGVDARQNGLVLFGRTVDRVDLTWSYNKGVTEQTLTSAAPGFVAPTLLVSDRAASITDLAVVADTGFTVNGNDGEGLGGSLDSDTNFVRYGNFVRWGSEESMIGLPASGLQPLFNGLANSVNSNTRARSIFASGGENEHTFYFLPERFGEPTFQKGIFVGGFVRLKNVGGVLMDAVPDGEEEIAISINNGFAAENYYVYMTLYDNQADAVTPVVVS